MKTETERYWREWYWVQCFDELRQLEERTKHLSELASKPYAARMSYLESELASILK